MAAAAMDLSEYENDPRLFLFTSLTAGSSHIITATSRMETILKANKIPFQAIDTATDEKARRLWQRRANKKKLPGLVKDGFVLADLEEVEDWNEFGELKENIGPVPANAPASGTIKGVNTAPPMSSSPAVAVQQPGNVRPAGINKAAPPLVDESKMRALPGAAEIAARNKQQSTSTPVDEPPSAVESMTTAPAAKEQSINVVKEISQHHPSLAHLSAPASRIQSGTATPQPEPTLASSEQVQDTATSTEVEGQGEKVPVEEPKSIESEIGNQEEVGEKDSVAPTEAVQEGETGEGKATQEQDAKEGENASKSVED